MNNILLIDAYHLFHRTYYTFRNLKLKSGDSVGMIYGTIYLLLHYKDKFKPCDIIMCYDNGRSGRQEIYADYKADRVQTKNGFNQQLIIVKSLLKDMGVKYAEYEDAEADDVIGSLSTRFENDKKIIISGDHDYFQLINENVNFYKIGKHDKMYHLSLFIEEYGIHPSRYAEMLYLRGDSSDNVPGIAKVGAKTALSIVKSTQTFDEVLKHKKVVDHIDIVQRNKDILTIKKKLDVIVKKDIKNLHIVKCLFEDYFKFDSFIRRWNDIEVIDK